MSEWQKVKIGDVCTITKGATGIQKAIAGKYPMVTLAEERTTHNEFQFDCDAVIVPLVSSTGHGHASMKRVHYQEGKFALGSILCAVVPNNSNFLNPKYLHIYLSYLKEKLLVPLMRGAANVSLSISNIKTVEIIVPPIEKQIEIIELEEKIRIQKQKLDKKNSDKNNYLALLRQQILRDAVSGKLTDDWRKKNPDIEPASKLLEKIKAEKEKLIAKKKIKKEKPLPKIAEDEIPFELPEKWEWCRFGEVVNYKLGKTPPSKDTRYWKNGEYEWVSISDMTEYGIVQDTQRKVTQLAVDKVFKYQPIPQGTLLMSFKLTIGRTSILGADSYHNEAIISIYPYHIEYKKFLFYFLPIFSQWGNKRKAIKGNTLNSKKLNNLTVPLPPLAEQKEIVTKIEKLIKHVSELEEKIKQNKQDAEMLMQSFLVEAFKN